MYMLEKRLAKNLKKIRGDRSQLEFAKKLGISRPSLTRLENADQNVTLKTLEQITRALKCDMNSLFREDD
jgi:transcriptional regulator with XRE-family HTH domain